MKDENRLKLRIGEWRVDPASGRMERGGETVRLDVRSVRLLQCLAERAGQVVSIDDLISYVWGGVAVSPDSVYQAVTALRRQLGDDSRQPAYIETVPRLGYRMIAEVSRCAYESEASANSTVGTAPGSPVADSPRVGPSSRSVLLRSAVLVAVAALGFIGYLTFSSRGRPVTSAPVVVPQLSIGVLPFLDLTEGMHNGEFADGMTEELIDKLSKIPGLSVPSASASFYYKDKEMPVSEIAKGLKVAYLLDGSVRKSGGRIRIAARLVRAENSYVLWTDTYDRPGSDLIMVQDEIASEVAKALPSSAVLAPGRTGSH